MIEQLLINNEEKTILSVGVYCIYHAIAPSTLYVGSTNRAKGDRRLHCGFYSRFYWHYYQLNKNLHYSKGLQEIVNQYGMDGIRFKVLEVCDGMTKTQIVNREQFYLNITTKKYNYYDTVYPKGRVHTKESRLAQSRKMKGRAFPIEVYERIKKPVFKISGGVVLHRYDSIHEAARQTKIDRASISKCCSGERKCAGGFSWQYLTTPERS